MVRAGLLERRLAQLLGWWGQVSRTSYRAEQWEQWPERSVRVAPVLQALSFWKGMPVVCSLCSRGSRKEKATQRMT